MSNKVNFVKLAWKKSNDTREKKFEGISVITG